MMKILIPLYSFLILISIFSCQENNNNQELLKEQQKLLKEVEDLKHSIKEGSSVKKTVKIDKPAENEIKRGLLTKTVKYNPTGKKRDEISWTFAALSEFRDLRILEENQDGNYWEAKVDLDLEDFKTGKNYFMKGLVQCMKDGSQWHVTNFEAIEYRAQ